MRVPPTACAVLLLLAACGSADEQARPEVPAGARPSAPAPSAVTPSALGPGPSAAAPPPVGPEMPRDLQRLQTVTGVVGTREDGCRVLRGADGVEHVLRGDLADVPATGRATLRGLARVQDDGPCAGLALVVDRAG